MADRVAIGVRRLAIIDVQHGHQPVSDEAGDVWVAHNGEIYNYLSLRNELVEQGHRFRTHSDTEVIAHLYRRYGLQMLDRLRGMFGLCIYDERDKSVTLARDAFGEKPLFYARVADGLVFASEIPALLAGAPWLPRTLDREALAYYLRANLVPAPLTMFAAVRQLEPGSWLRWQDGDITSGSYYRPSLASDPALDDEAAAIDAIGRALQQAVSRQLVGERPLGMLLSGGIDSGGVASFCTEAQAEPVKTYTMGFDEAGYDESDAAARTARHLGSDHTRLQALGSEFTSETFWRIVDHMGVPFSDSSAIPMYLVSQAAAAHVTVALSGDGGDEIFAGYPELRWGLALGKLRGLPNVALALMESVTGMAGRVVPGPGSQAARRARRALRLAQLPMGQAFAELHSLFSEEEVGALVGSGAPDLLEGPLSRLAHLPSEADTWSPLKRLMYYRLRYVLPEDMLVKVDRMSMAASLEVRSPMLDRDLAALALSLPDKHLVRGSIQKYVLRQVLKDRLPREIFLRRKTGFSIPLHRLQNQEYRALADELLTKKQEVMDLFSTDALERVTRTALAAQESSTASVYRSTHQLWALMQLAGWGKRFGVSA
jgi:asparagine synthase (glutamine-hydrolysing)